MNTGMPGPDGSGGGATAGPRPGPVDLYEVLEVSPRASKAVIHAAYRALVRAYHPDSNGGSAESSERMRQLNAAYRVLSDPSDRARYDLEAARMRRAERLAQSMRLAPGAATPHAPARLLAARPATVADHRNLLSGQVLLGLVAFVAVAVIMMTLVWVTMDPDPDDQIVMYPGTSGEVIRH
jgi:hypothetical protein